MEEKYFNKEYIADFKLPIPCKKSARITELRRLGDLNGQYVCNLYYLDTLELSHDQTAIYSIYNSSDPVYSEYHGDCDFCREHKRKVLENPVVGFRIYPRGVAPEKTYKQRKEEWKKFKQQYGK